MARIYRTIETLKSLKSGLENVQTYIQSSNTIIQSSQEITKTIESTIEKSISDYFNFEVTVLVRTKSETKIILDNCPFSEVKKRTSYTKCTIE